MSKLAHNTDTNLSRKDERRSYWESFYAAQKSGVPTTPSQFAVFALKELPQIRSVIEVGCGNGRDSEFFASCGLQVFATDASDEAVKYCRSQQKTNLVTYEPFMVGGNIAPVSSYVEKTPGPIMLYARFFLHAISATEEDIFFDMARDIIPKGNFIALEYRVLEDAGSEKVFGSHYRRYVDHGFVCDQLKLNGFEVSYETQGKDLAKYKTENAKVGRCIAVRT